MLAAGFQAKGPADARTWWGVGHVAGCKEG